MCSLFLIIVVFVTLSSSWAGEIKFRPATAQESFQLKKYLQQSGLLHKGHAIRKLNPGPAFQVAPQACKDGDDLYFLSFDGGIDLKMPAHQALAEFYRSGTGGTWSPIFRYDRKTGFFQFLGAGVHKGLSRLLKSEGECPDLEVVIHGSYCGKAGAEPCSGTLLFQLDSGYSLALPK